MPLPLETSFYEAVRFAPGCVDGSGARPTHRGQALEDEKPTNPSMVHQPSFVALTDQDFLKEAEAIVRVAQADGTSLRILGSLGIYAHSAHVDDAIPLFHALGRVSAGTPLFTDLDLMGYAKQGRAISGVLERLGFKPDNMVNGFFGDRRLIYYEGTGKFHVDIFLDKLEFSHDVEFGHKPGEGRLELDFPTIALTDIVLEKLQIHKIARKDLVDLMILFFGHEVKPSAASEKEAIDAGYIARLLADDWGFWYESTQNLMKTRQLMGTFLAEGRMTQAHVSRIEARLGSLEAALHAAPKGKHWEKRAKTGTAKPWFREVEEVVR